MSEQDKAGLQKRKGEGRVRQLISPWGAHSQLLAGFAVSSRGDRTAHSGASVRARSCHLEGA
jgi:hypothetical protein